MKVFLSRANRFLETPLDLGPRLLMLAAVGCLVAIFFFPLWNLTMFAPQYPDGLRLDIYAYTMRRRQRRAGHQGDQRPQSLHRHARPGDRRLHGVQVDAVRHRRARAAVLRAVVHGTMAALVDVCVLFVYFGAFSLWSFGYKLYRYGHDLSPQAAVSVPPFTPPMFGYQKIANFEVYSYPQPASYFMGVALLLLATALALAWMAARRDPARARRA